MVPNTIKARIQADTPGRKFFISEMAWSGCRLTVVSAAVSSLPRAKLISADIITSWYALHQKSQSQNLALTYLISAGCKKGRGLR